MKISAIEILHTDKSKIYDLPHDIILLFDNNIEINTTVNKLIYSYLFWDIHRKYPKTPLLPTHTVDYVLKGKPLTSKTHIKLLEIIYKDVCIAYNFHLPEQKEDLWEMIYKVTNNVYNDMSRLSEPDVSSIDILDFTQVVRYEPVKKAVSEVTGTEISIAHCYDTVASILKSDPYLNNNALALAVRADMVSLHQVLQCISPRGRLTEVDGSILPIPVLSNFTEGLTNFYELIAESRSAAKSLYFSDAKLQDAEYFARRIQLLCMVVESIDYIDCGSTKTIDWRVMPPTYDEEGNKTYAGDLEFMVGKNYYDSNNVLCQIQYDENGKLDETLYDTNIKLRTVLYCKHPDPHKVCEVCFGALSRNVSKYANLGHLCAATMTKQTTQSVLSIKHLDKSSSGTAIVLDGITTRYFYTNKSKNYFFVKPELKEKKIQFIVSRDEAVGLVDILHIDNLDNLNPVRISAIECVGIILDDGRNSSMTPVFVSQGNKKVMLTIEFLKYLKVHRWEMDDKNNFVFDLVDWDYKKPIFKLPDMEYSFSDHSNMIAKVIESSMKNISDRAQPYSPVSTLMELFVLVNTKISVNISALEVIMYAAMVPNIGEFALGRNCEEPVLGVADQVIKSRSLGTAYCYEDIFRLITDPKSFQKLDRPSSVFDVFICPNEYLKMNKHS